MLSRFNQDNLSTISVDELYQRVLSQTQEKIAQVPFVQGDRRVYYMSAEFLVGKLLTNNLMNLGIYDELNDVLHKHGRSLTELEEFEAEPSLGNGGLGRLAACFLDSIATLGIPGEGLGLNYHFGLFKQVFSQDHFQKEMPDEWLNKPSWLRKTDYVTDVQMGKTKVQSRMYELDVLGYNQEKTVLRLFDLESVDKTLIKEGITFDQLALDKNLTLFLYPDDSTEAGKRLRFAQQYFMVKSGIDWILRCHGEHIHELDKHVVIQINDTHPAMAIPMMMLRLLDAGIEYNQAVEILTNTFAYTNHTILAEALETWPLDYFKQMDSKLADIIVRMDRTVRERSNDPFIGIIGYYYLVHMASLAVNYSFSTNGVAALHSDILKRTTLKSFYSLYPERFDNKTNGVTFRRWLLFSNPELSQFIESRIGREFKNDAYQLKKLHDYMDDKATITELLRIKDQKKQDLADYLLTTTGRNLNPHSIFDIQIKRLHEYKRQQMNLLYIIDLYLRIKDGYQPQRPVTFIFGSKAAPAYVNAKDIIHALLVLSEIIRQDNDVNQFIDILFVENYNVTKAEKLIPACDVSEQISLASKEASGTGNMKLMLNGALTLGTLDGANVEIADLVGEGNIFIFGKHSDDIIKIYEEDSYHPNDYYGQDARIRRVVDFLISEPMRQEGNEVSLYRLYHNIKDNDHFMTLIDLEDYIRVKDAAFASYEDRLAWGQKMLANIAEAGYFSSDRTISDYNRDIWKALPNNKL